MSIYGNIIIALFAFAISSLFLTSCGDEISEQQTELIGNWIITKAMQDGNQTNRLDGIYLNLEDENKATTNFNPELEPRSFDFRMRGQQIILISNGDQITFQIVHQSDNELIVNSKLMDFDFELHLQRDKN